MSDMSESAAVFQTLATRNVGHIASTPQTLTSQTFVEMNVWECVPDQAVSISMECEFDIHGSVCVFARQSEDGMQMSPDGIIVELIENHEIKRV